jgi:hypothetical protein
MPSTPAIERAIDQLRPLAARVASGEDDLEGITAARADVMSRYGRVFAPTNESALTAEDFLGFLNFKNNRHWSGLHRQGPKMVRDMPRLKCALAILLDESRSIRARFDEILPKGKPPMVAGLGRAVLTPILMLVYPDRYAVWNGKAKAGMLALGIYPDLGPGASSGERYEAVNRIALEIGQALGVDTWTLDALWWRAMKTLGAPTAGEEDEGAAGDMVADGTAEPQRFRLEAQLHEFLRDNWELTALGRDWAIHTEDGETDAGYKYRTEVGEIDLLAKHRQRNAWLVVELKRDRTSDTAVGQVLRYIGWVKRELAGPGDDVQGLVVAHRADAGLKYALADQPNIKLQLYDVAFTLKDPPPVASGKARA